MDFEKVPHLDLVCWDFGKVPRLSLVCWGFEKVPRSNLVCWDFGKARDCFCLTPGKVRWSGGRRDPVLVAAAGSDL